MLAQKDVDLTFEKQQMSLHFFVYLWTLMLVFSSIWIAIILYKNACTWWPRIIHSSVQPVKIRICSTNQKPVATLFTPPPPFFVCVKDEKKIKNTMKRQFDGVVLKLISCYWRIKSVPSPYIDHWPSTNHSDYKSAWRE